MFGALSALTFRVRAGRQTLFLGHVQFPATACHRSALVSVPRRPRTASPGKSKMVSSSCCPVSPHPHSTLPLHPGYRHQKAPRQEGQPYRAQERGSLPALAGQGTFIWPRAFGEICSRLPQLYRFLARRTDSAFNKVILCCSFGIAGEVNSTRSVA